MNANGGVPLILPTTSGYRFAQGLEHALRTKYIPARNDAPDRPNLWIPVKMTVFGDTDHIVEIQRHIRGEDVYIISDPYSHAIAVPDFPPDEYEGHIYHLRSDGMLVKDKKDKRTLETVARKLTVSEHFDILSSTVEAARNAVKSGRLTAIIPCFPSAKQDRRGGRRSLDLKRRIETLEALGINHVVTIDIHNPDTELAFQPNTDFDHLYAAYTFIRHMQDNPQTYDPHNMHFLAPDSGAFERNKTYATALEASAGFLYKNRVQNQANTLAEPFGYGGDIEEVVDKDVIIVDDQIDTGTTLRSAVSWIKDKGARSVRAVAVHSVFSHPALKSLRAAYEQGNLAEVLVTDSVTLRQDQLEANKDWLTKITIIPYFAKVIDHLNQGLSISGLLNETG